MSYWNQGYNRKKQEQMLRNASEQERQKSLTTSRPLYREFSSFGTQRLGRQLQKQKEKQFWIIGGVIIGIVAIVGILATIWAMNI